MRRLFILFFIFPIICFTQKSKSDSLYEYTYFKNGKVATKRLLLNEKVHFGYLIAYDFQGKEIYNMSTRNIGGHASIHVEFYPSGAIKTAHYTSQPDGGIQRGDVKHYFDESGTVTNVVDMSDDGFGRTVVTPIFKREPQEETPFVPTEKEKPQTVPKPITKEVVECAIIYSTEIYLVNYTRKTQQIITEKKPSNGQAFKETYTIQPGDTLFLGYYIGAQNYVDASTVFSARVEQKKKTKSNPYYLIWDKFVQPKAELRQYHLLLIERVGK